MIRNQLLLAIDQFEAGEAAVDVTIGLTSLSDAHVTVFHVRELSPMLRVHPSRPSTRRRTWSSSR